MAAKKKKRTKNKSCRMKGIFLSCLQGIHHHTDEFSDRDISAAELLSTAKNSGVNAVIVEPEYARSFVEHIPLIVALNGRTRFKFGDPILERLCDVSGAKKIGAAAGLFTLYIGGFYEKQMCVDLVGLMHEARKSSFPIIVSVVPMGAAILKPNSLSTILYCLRTALELSSENIAVTIPMDYDYIPEIIKASGDANVIFIPDSQYPDHVLKQLASRINDSGGSGIALGRTLWKRESPKELVVSLKKRID